MNNPSPILGKREGSMAEGQARGYVLVRGYNSLLPLLELMMLTLNPHMIRSVNRIV